MPQNDRFNVTIEKELYSSKTFLKKNKTFLDVCVCVSIVRYSVFNQI